MPSILGNAVAILSSSLAGSNVINTLVASLCARATSCENTSCTKATLQSLQNCP